MGLEVFVLRNAHGGTRTAEKELERRTLTNLPRCRMSVSDVYEVARPPCRRSRAPGAARAGRCRCVLARDSRVTRVRVGVLAAPQVILSAKWRESRAVLAKMLEQWGCVVTQVSSVGHAKVKELVKRRHSRTVLIIEYTQYRWLTNSCTWWKTAGCVRANVGQYGGKCGGKYDARTAKMR
eukprot:2138783-Pyramimonas_sp.AAC.1